ncbi:hypothetical protein ACMBCN_01210, partial [Candidatus Liberibacter asiaticus]|nr:hypothetical protein [Candidatus Liberibacter asiaticus]
VVNNGGGGVMMKLILMDEGILVEKYRSHFYHLVVMVFGVPKMLGHLYCIFFFFHFKSTGILYTS